MSLFILQLPPSTQSPTASLNLSKDPISLKVVRCLLALLMKSLTSPDPALNCLPLLISNARFHSLLCHLVSSNGGDALVDSASIRILGIVSDETQWKIDISQMKPINSSFPPEPIFSALARTMESNGASISKLLNVISSFLNRNKHPATAQSFSWIVVLQPRPIEALGQVLRNQLLPMSADLCRLTSSHPIKDGLLCLWGAANLTWIMEGGTLSDPKASTSYVLSMATLIQGAGNLKPSSASDAPKVLSALSTLTRRSFLVPLFETLEGVQGGVEAFSLFCDAALISFPKISSALNSSVSSKCPNVLNTLAFAPNILPRMWRWLSFSLGLPLEAPLGATRGLDVASLSRGFRDLSHDKSIVLGVFCRLYHHLLLVLDDYEFHELQKPLNLGQARAIATSINSLVVHSYLPKSRVVGISSNTVVMKLGASNDCEAPQLLSEYAPLLVASLFERDSRRAFCQPLLWLAPWNEMEREGLLPSSPPEPSKASNDLQGPQKEQAVLASTAIIGGWTAASIVACLETGAGASSAQDYDDEIMTLSSKAGEGLRPSSLASLLKKVPQAIPYSHRIFIFRAMIEEDKRRGGYGKPVHEGGHPPIKVSIKRQSLLEDAYRALSHLGPALKARLSVSFVNSAGESEAGIDYGGLMKELLDEVLTKGMDPNLGLFSATSDGLMFTRASSDRIDQGLEIINFLGLILGKILYEGLLLNSLAFAPFFVSRIQGRLPAFDDLASLDSELYKSLQMVKRYEGNVEDLGLTFTVEEDFFGQTRHHELLPGWGDTAVTADNRLLYVHLLSDHHLNRRLGRSADAFARGLFHLIPSGSFRLFTPKELNDLLGGGRDGLALDIDDLMQHTKYSGGYSETSSSVRSFWSTVRSMNPREMAQLLKFVTSCSRAPIGGFKFLHPPFTIHKVDCDHSALAYFGGKDVDRLPSASTCFNMIKLPNYQRTSTLRAKLLYAIGSSSGFELS